MEKVRLVKSRALADALVWIGFDYEKDVEDNFLFKRTTTFDMAFNDLHYLRSVYRARTEHKDSK